MRRSLHPRSRVFRWLLMLGLLAWTTLAFNAFAAPLAMTGESAAVETAMTAVGKAVPSHCNDVVTGYMSHDSSAMPAHPMGRGCCQHGRCHCPSLCNGVANVPDVILTWQPPHTSALLAKYTAPVPARSAPPFRPPIA